MHFDFSAALTLATLLTGLVSLVYWLMLRARNKQVGDKEPWLVEYSKSFFPVLLFVLVLLAQLRES